MNNTELPNYMRTEAIVDFDVIRVQVDGSPKQITAVVMACVQDMDRKIASFDVFPVNPVAPGTAIIKKDSFGISSPPYKDAMGLTEGSDFVINFTPIRLMVRDVDLIEQIGNVTMWNVRNVTSREFKERASLEERGSDILDGATLAKLQSGMSFRPASPVFTVKPVLGARASEEKLDNILPLFAPSQSAKNTDGITAENLFKTGEVEPVEAQPGTPLEKRAFIVEIKSKGRVRQPLPVPAKTAKPNENPTLSQLEERSQLTSYARWIFSGEKNGSETGPVLNKQGKPLLNDNNEPVVIKTLVDLNNLFNNLGGPAGVSKQVRGMGPKLAGDTAADLEAAVKIYPR